MTDDEKADHHRAIYRTLWNLIAERDRLAARVASLEAGLRPFVEHHRRLVCLNADGERDELLIPNGGAITFGDCRRAASLLAPTPEAKCWCLRCNPKSIFFVVCPACGNKRCPRATHHVHECTGSNEPGQPGSDYPALTPETP